MQNFILDFILPEIAWNMERNGEFYIYPEDIEDTVEEILTSKSKISVCGKYGKALFNKYNNNSTDIKNTYITAKKIIEKMGEDMSVISERILKCCVFAFGIMQNHFGKYGFVHQHIRDYFAAIKNINTIRLSVYLYEENEKELALECMNKTFKDEPVNYIVRRFMGEYLGEHRNKPYYVNGKWNYGVPTGKYDRNLIKRALDIYRGCFDGECGYGVYSIITILIDVRKDLSGSDFSYLDLRHICFNFNTILGQKNCVADFFASKIDDTNFLLANHSENFSIVALNPDGTEVATVIGDSVIVIWNLKLKKQCYVLRQHTASINSIGYSPDGKYFVSCAKDNTAVVWNTKTYKLVTSLSSENLDFNSLIFEDKGIKLSGFSQDSSHIFILDRDDIITIFNVGDFSIKQHINNSYIFNFDGEDWTKGRQIGLVNVFFLDNKSIVGVFGCCDIKIWNIETGRIIFENNYGDIEHITFNPETQCLIYSIANKIYVLDLVNHIITNENTHSEEINDIYFVSKKQILVVSNYCNVFLYDIGVGCYLFKNHTDEIISISNVVNNKIAICDRKNVYIHNINSMLIEHSINNYNKHGHCIAYSNDGKYFAVPTSDAMIKIFETKNNCCINQLQGNKKNVLHLQFSKNDKFLISISKDNVVKIWDMDESECTATLVHDSPVYAVDTDDSNKFFLSACNEKVLLWDIELNACVKTFTGFEGKINDAKFSPDFKSIIAVSDKYIKIIDVKQKKILKTFLNQKKGMRYCAAIAVNCFNNSERVAIKYNDDSIGILNLKNFVFENKIEPSKFKIKSTTLKIGVQALLFPRVNIFADLIEGTFDYNGFVSSGDKYIATVAHTSNEVSILIFSAESYKVISGICLPSHLPQFIKFSPNEKFLITSTVNSNYVSVWDIKNKKMNKLDKHKSNVVSAFFTNDGDKIISISEDDIIITHSAETLECIDEIQLSDGYNVLNVNFKNIHVDSELSEKKKGMLKTYGAIID